MIKVLLIIIFLWLLLRPSIDKYTDANGKKHIVIWYGVYNRRFIHWEI